MISALHHALSSPRDARFAPIDGLDAWWSVFRAEESRSASLPALAFSAGFASDRLGWAFASGYQCAGRALFEGAPDVPSALCVTESAGGHPRAMQTTLLHEPDGLRLDGEKSFVTLGEFARVLHVVARVPDGGERPTLVLVQVPSNTAGVTFTPLALPPIAPEVPHARVRFENVRLPPEAALPGDGYDRYVKPFRTVEDIYVMLAVTGWLLRVARSGGAERSAVETLSALAVTLGGLAREAPSDPAVHVALAGALPRVDEAIRHVEPCWAKLGATHRERWERDRPLLAVASKVREARRDRAHERLR